MTTHEPALPRALDGEYRAIACKKAVGDSAVFLALRRDTGREVLIKVASSAEKGLCLKNEYQLLKRLEGLKAPEAALFPRAVDCLSLDEGWVLVREYIPGQSMEEYVESEPSRPGIPRDMALRCLIWVLEQLRVLHRMRPPVIHRDVKPQNVILDAEGGFHLIDLGIAREYRAGDETDTQVMGTSLTAPPEQYGFRQTDERSDIYSAGVLLRYCLTQEYGERADADIDEDLRAIVKRATQFDPQMRYQRAEDMLAALRCAAPGHLKRPARRWVAAAVLLLLALCLAAVIALNARRPYAFREPLIEQAVRLALDRPEGPLSASDLASVTALHIFGRQVYDDDGEFWFLGENVFPYDEALRQQASWRENGGIASLDDLRALPNLTELSLYRQSICDISALRDMKLRALGIGYNPVTDLSPLEGSEALESLNLSGLDISDTAVLATLPALRALSVSATAIEALPELPLTELNLVDAPFRFETLPALSRLEALTVSKLLPDHLFYLSRLPLKSLEVTHAQGLSPRDLEVLSGLERLSFRTEQRAVLSARPLRFARMEELVLKGVEVESLACLSELSNLRALGIYEADCADYGGLEGLTRLETVWATAEQAAALKALYPRHAWALVAG